MNDRAVGARGEGPASHRGTSQRPGLGSPRVVRAAFAFSIVVHVLAVLAYPLFVRSIRPEESALRMSGVGAAPQGIEVVNLVEVDAAGEIFPPEEPRRIAEIAAAAEVVRALPDEATVAVELPRPGLTPAERLMPGYTDRRLWAPLPPELTDLTLGQREELMIAGRIGAWYDSVAAAAAAQGAWTDWTFTDAGGGRWGVADGQLHLGDLTIPLPFTFEPPPGQRDYLWQWNEIARQGAQAAVQETIRERLEAIRARRDRERAAQQAADSARAARQRQAEPPGPASGSQPRAAPPHPEPAPSPAPAPND
jgi:hypothetical protein